MAETTTVGFEMVTGVVSRPPVDDRKEHSPR